MAAILGGCRANGPTGNAGLVASIEDPGRRLEALAELEQVASTSAGTPGRPPTHAGIVHVDPGYPPEIGTGSAEYREASRSLESVLDELTLPGVAEAPEAASPAQRVIAGRLYVRARASRQRGEGARAVELLEQAVTQDPASTTLWRELALAHGEAGNESEAQQAWQIAIELGDRSPEALLTLASEAGARRDHEGVITYAGALHRTPGAADDRSRAIGGAMLGMALLDRGNLRAGAGVLEETLGMLGRDASPGEPMDLTRLRARRIELAVRAGDAWAMLGVHARASEAYALAPVRSIGESLALTQRRVAALLSAHRPATAALLALDHIAQHAGDLGVEEGDWIRGLTTPDAGAIHVSDGVVAALRGMVGSTDRPLSERRQILRVAVRGLTRDADAQALLTSAGEPAHSPVIAGSLLWRVPADARVSWAIDAVSHDARLARPMGAALARLVPSPTELARSLLDSANPSARSLGLGICVAISTGEPARELVSRAEPGSSPASDPALTAEVLGLLGRWEAGDAWWSAAREQNDRVGLISAAIALARPDRASEVARQIDTDPDASTDEIVAACDAAGYAGNANAWRARIDRLRKLDPWDERGFERALLAGSPGATEDQEQQTRELGRELSERRARSGLFALLRARELGARGRYSESAELLIELGEREPERDLGLGMLVELLAVGGGTDAGGMSAIDRGRVLGWLRARCERVPGSGESALVLGQALALEDPTSAIEWLDTAYTRIGHPDLARAAESSIAQRDGVIAGARRTIQRTQPQAGIESRLDRMHALLVVGQPADSIRTGSSLLADGRSLGRAQRARWIEAVSALARSPDAEPGDTLSLMDLGERSGLTVPVPLRLGVLARSEDGLEPIQRLVSQAIELGGPDDQTGILAVRALLGEGRGDDALALLGRLAIGTLGGDPSGDLLDEWARLVGGSGEARNVRTLLGDMDGDASAWASVTLRARYGLGEPAGEPGESRDRADHAYACAVIASLFERYTQSESLYRLAIELDPTHGWSLNDLAYALVDGRAGETLDRDRLVEGEALARRAHAAIGEKASVLDTLAWARYRLGMLDDADGVEGAITLLRRSADLDDGRDNPTIHTHLGDALWRIGDPEGARASWEQASSLLRARAMEIARSESPASAVGDRVTRDLNAVVRRIKALDEGGSPPVEDWLGDG